jgi:hypothetical protein
MKIKDIILFESMKSCPECGEIFNNYPGNGNLYHKCPACTRADNAVRDQKVREMMPKVIEKRQKWVDSVKQWRNSRENDYQSMMEFYNYYNENFRGEKFRQLSDPEKKIFWASNSGRAEMNGFNERSVFALNIDPAEWGNLVSINGIEEISNHMKEFDGARDEFLQAQAEKEAADKEAYHQSYFQTDKRPNQQSNLVVPVQSGGEPRSSDTEELPRQMNQNKADTGKRVEKQPTPTKWGKHIAQIAAGIGIVVGGTILANNTNLLNKVVSKAQKIEQTNPEVLPKYVERINDLIQSAEINGNTYTNRITRDIDRRENGNNQNRVRSSYSDGSMNRK